MAATDATIFFNPSSRSVNVGDTFTLVARVNPGTNEVGAVDLYVSFEHSEFQLNSITRSSAFNTTLQSTFDNNAGTAVFSAGLLTTPATYVTSTSDVATFSFTSLSETSNSPINFTTGTQAAAHGENVTLSNTGATVTATLNDVTAPTFTVNDGASITYVQSDTINVSVSDSSGVASQFYGFSSDNTCNGSDTISTAFTSATNFNITGNHSDYLCVKATDSSVNNNVGYQTIGQLYVDNTEPTFSINEGVSSSSTKTDVINITVTDSAAGVASRYYGFSSDNTCNGSDTISTAFTSSTNFNITGNHSDYLCVKATDNAGNISYQTVGQLNVDNTEPTISQTTPISTNTYDTTPSYTFTVNEGGSISYGGSCSSATTSASSGSNTITFGTLSVGTYSNCTIRISDSAGNLSSILTVSSFSVTYRGDINNTPDHRVNASDFTILADDYGENICGPTNKADINQDCHVNASDFTLLADDYGESF